MGVKIQECKYCKKLFQSFGSNICPACVEEMEENFETVKEYIYNNPGENVVQISEGTGVPEKMVLYYLREGRLAIEGADSSLTCEKCRKPISCGRFCRECQVILEGKLLKSYSESRQKLAEEAKEALLGKMHFNYQNK